MAPGTRRDVKYLGTKEGTIIAQRTEIRRPRAQIDAMHLEAHATTAHIKKGS